MQINHTYLLQMSSLISEYFTATQIQARASEFLIRYSIDSEIPKMRKMESKNSYVIRLFESLDSEHQFQLMEYFYNDAERLQQEPIAQKMMLDLSEGFSSISQSDEELQRLAEIEVLLTDYPNVLQEWKKLKQNALANSIENVWTRLDYLWNFY